MTDYITVAELKVDIDKTLPDDDASLAILVTAASHAIDTYCNRPDGFVALAVATARYYVGSGKPWQEIDECTAVTALDVKDSPTDDETDYIAWVVGTVGVTAAADVFPATGAPQYPEYNRTPYTLLICGGNGEYSLFTSGRLGLSDTDAPRGVPTVKVTAKWGYATTCPAQIAKACGMQTARWYKRLQSGMSDTLASGELGQLMYTQKLDPDVEMILRLGRFVRPVVPRL